MEKIFKIFLLISFVLVILISPFAVHASLSMCGFFKWDADNVLYFQEESTGIYYLISDNVKNQFWDRTENITDDCGTWGTFIFEDVQIENATSPTTLHFYDRTVEAEKIIISVGNFVCVAHRENMCPLMSTDTPMLTVTPLPASTQIPPTSIEESPTITEIIPTEIIDDPISIPFDPEKARILLDEKRQLANKMENVNIPTRLFTIPGIKAYDETEALQLVDHFSNQLDIGMMRFDDYERLKRLIIQEEMLSDMLPVYVETTSTVAKSIVDMIKTVLSFNKTMDNIVKNCDHVICEKVIQQQEKLAWRLLRTFGKQFIQAGADKIDTPEAMGKIWDLGLRIVEEKIEKNGTLQSMLVDNAMDSLFTTAMINPYLRKTQKMLDYGVATADSSVAYGYDITSDSDRAISLTGELVQKAGWESDLAVGRYEDFSRAANLSQIAIDISDLGSLANPTFSLVSIFSRVENLIVHCVLVLINTNNMECIEYLTTRASEMSFDADQPSDDCRYLQSSQIPVNRKIKVAAASLIQPKSNLHVAVMQDESDYRHSLKELIDAFEKGDPVLMEEVVDNFLIAEEKLWQSLDKSRNSLWLQDQTTLASIDFISQTAGYEFTQMALYYAIIEHMIALENGESAESTLNEMADMALSRLDEVELSIQQVDLKPPANKPLVVIRNVIFSKPSFGIIPLQVNVENMGNIDASDLTIILEGGQTQLTNNLSLAEGEKSSLAFDVELNEQIDFSIKLFSPDGELLDLYLDSFPLETADNLKEPINFEDVEVKKIPVLGLVIMILVGIGIVVIVFSGFSKHIMGKSN
jgi:hypothetical protein